MKDKEQLVLDNQGLIIKVMKDLHLYWENDEEFDDYYYEGLIGLIKGAKEYDYSKSNSSTFLYVCIKNQINHFLLYKNTKGRTNPYGKDVSLNTLISEEDELLDIIPDKNDVSKEVEKKIREEAILEAINNLPREKDGLVIKMYYGLDGYPALGSLKKVSEVLGVSNSMVYQRYHRAIYQLKWMFMKNDRDLYFEEYWRNRKKW